MDALGPDLSAVVGVFVVAGLVALGVAVFQWLWNTTLPELFNVKTVRYWQAFRLLLLVSMLTSGLWIRLDG